MTTKADIIAERNKINIEIKSIKKLIERAYITANTYRNGNIGNIAFSNKKIKDTELYIKEKEEELERTISKLSTIEVDLAVEKVVAIKVLKISTKSSTQKKKNFSKNTNNNTTTHKIMVSKFDEPHDKTQPAKVLKEIKDSEKHYAQYCAKLEKIPDYMKEALKTMPANKGYIFRGIYLFGYLNPEKFYDGTEKPMVMFENKDGKKYVHRITTITHSLYEKQNRREILIEKKDRRQIKQTPITA